MNPKLRDFFDIRLERVLAGLPDWLLKLIDEVPLVVEDYPSRELMHELGVRHRSELCGLYTGVPLSERSVQHSARLPDQITIFRLGILRQSENARGDLDERELQRQIRITVLHELAHYHGIGEAELESLGYG